MSPIPSHPSALRDAGARRVGSREPRALPPGRVLVIDDDPRLGALLQRVLGDEGLHVQVSRDPTDGLERLRREPFDVLLTDVELPGLDGLEVLRRALALRPGCRVVLMTAFASVASARAALKAGAADYLTKPFSSEQELKPLLRSLLGRDADPRAEPQAPGSEALARLVGESPAIVALRERIRRVADSEASVLIHGESGVGKELVARAIHALSPRGAGPWTALNCGALPETLVEGELFGHVRGAFTGAVRDRAGLLETADGGTLFLDEVGELPLALQPKLLRVLQEREFQRLGDVRRTIRVDVRVLAATNRDLPRDVRQGRFREDLYYRLHVVPIEVPPLRARREDLPHLVRHFAARLMPGRPVRLAHEVWEAFARHAWPGNVRELANVLEHALVLRGEGEVRLVDLPRSLAEPQAREPQPRPTPGPETLAELERRRIEDALRVTGGNRTRAARLLGITRRALSYRIAKHGLEPERA
jgi:DNA-binding NtrC family response regulator